MLETVYEDEGDPQVGPLMPKAKKRKASPTLLLCLAKLLLLEIWTLP